ncbi:MAG: LacI family DNA-binding transcriptional regulator [Natronospirillum sp.]
MPKPSNSTVSMADVARLAGVSESTVSRALNNNPAINVATRERIQGIAQSLGYRPNIGARNLRLQRSHIIAVVINHDSTREDSTTQSLADPFMTTITSAIADALNEQHYGLLFASSHIKPGMWYEHLLQNGRADGLIVIGRGANEASFSDLLAADAPFVVWGQADASTPYTCIGSDNLLGGQQAAQQLILSGSTLPLFLGDIQHTEIRQRYAGFQQAFRQAHIEVPPPVFTDDFSPESGYRALKQWISGQPQPFDGLFAASDNLALGALQALHEHGVRIPRDVAVIGYDDIDLAAVSIPPLTSIHQEIKRGGKLLVNALMDTLEGRPVRSQRIPTRVVIRQTSCHISNKPTTGDF